MEQERLRRIQTVYSDAASLAPEQRDEFLESACSDDPSLRWEVESLLACESAEATLLDKPAMQFAAESLAGESLGFQTGRMFGRYQLLGLAGRGGMGDVYCAVDLRLNRLVAVKLVSEHVALQEARTIATLNHPHICILHDAGNDRDTHYLVFEYLVGDLLSDRLAQGPLPPSEAIRYLIQIGEALEYAHQQDVVHRDLKPQNIMLTRTGVKLLDFGIEGAGTPAYLAPEQTEGRATDARSDIFAFGRMALEMTDCVQPPLNNLIAKCLAPQPEDRWQSISDVLEIMRRI